MKEILLDFFVGLTFFSFFLLSSVQIASLNSVVGFQQKISGVYEKSGLEKEEVISITSQTLDFVKGRSLPSLPYTPREIFHLGEVKNIFAKTRFLWLISAALSFLILLWSNQAVFLWRQRFKKIYKGVTLALLALDLITFFFFPFVFEEFHSLFFKEGSWVFSENDLLIRLFPYRFWFCQTFLTLGLATLFPTGAGFLPKILVPKH